jgi:Tfp pilus assembly protein PilF
LTARDNSPRPGALSALLAELASAPRPGPSWDRGLRPGASIGRFELRREIGRGGFGVVYEAFDRELGRTVAFKAVRAGGDETEREQRLEHEAEAVARLAHPNLVTLYDAGRCEHGPYLVLELLRGVTLEERLAHGPLALREALRVAIEAVRGVAHAHAQGVVHRDLKPSNVFLCDDGQVKVLDFGLAHAFGRPRTAGGTPAYMAPEQWRGAPEDERTDVFALGVLLYQMLSGELPYPDDGGKSVLAARRARELEIGDAPALGPLVARMVAKDPVHRPRHAGEVLAALTAFERELVRTPSSVSVPVRPRPRALPRYVLPAALGIIVGVVAAAVAARALRTPSALPVGPEGRVVVAVADVENATGDPSLDGLSGLLITALEQSRRLEVLTRARVLDVLHQAGHDQVDRVDERLAREASLRTGSALVLATLHRFDDVYSLDLRILDPRGNGYLLATKETGRGKASIPNLVDRLSDRTREGLSEPAGEVRAARTRVASALATNLEAYQHYFRAQQRCDADDFPACIAELRKALAVDPDFPLAHYGLAYAFEFAERPVEDRRAEIEAALRGASRLPDKERTLVEAWKHHLDGRPAAAHATYARAADAYPNDKAVLYLAGDLYFHEPDFARARPYFERAAALDPSWENALTHLVTTEVALRRSTEAVERARAWVRAGPASADAHSSLGEALAAAGAGEEALAEDRRAVDLGGAVYQGDTAQDLITAGRFRQAELAARAFLAWAQGQRAASADPTALSRPERNARVLLAETLAYQGRRREALALLGDAPALAAARALVHAADHDAGAVARDVQAAVAFQPTAAALGAALFAYTGDVARAIALARVAANGDPSLRLYEAVSAARRGETAPLSALAGEGDAAAAYLLGEALLERGDAAGAAAALREFQEAPRTRSTWFHRKRLLVACAYPRSFLLLARALDRQGDHDGAAAAARRLVALWPDADDGSVLAEARSLGRARGR